MKNVTYKFFGLLIWFNTFIAYGQTFNVEGNISTGSTTVKYASITFIDKNDTLKKYTAITDIYGNYRLDIITDVEKGKPTLPQTIVLEQNYPNPFSTSTEIPYKLSKPQDISVKIFDILGREVRTFKKGLQGTGTYGITWDGKDNFGRKVTAGVYFYQLKTQDGIQVKKMIFGLGATNSAPLVLGRLSPITIGGLRKENNVQLTGGTFTVKIQDISNTEPRFLPDEFDDIIIQNDTTLNFTVEGGKIVFTSDSSGSQHIWVVYPDGSGLKQLTFGGYNDDMPRWSPDGKQIVFVSTRRWTSLGSPMYIMNADGSNIRPVKEFSNPTLFMPGEWPSWSPDGNKIVFDWCTYCELGLIAQNIYTVDLTTGEMKQLTDTLTLSGNTSPVWSRDGKKIYFNSNRHDPNNGLDFDIYYMNNDGSDVQRVTTTPGGFSSNPSFSPDGKKMVFIQRRSLLDSLSILMMDSNASNPVKIATIPTSGIYSYVFPRWSPNSTKLLLPFSEYTGKRDVGMYIIDINGKSSHLVLPENITVRYPDWTK